MERQFSTFYLDDLFFGIDILTVNEINRQLDVTPVCGGPSFVRGLLNLRGQIVTVIDLRARLGLSDGEANSKMRCVVLKPSSALQSHREAGRLDDDTCPDVVGLLVDRIGDMVTVDDDDIEPPPPNVGDIDCSYLSGVVQLPEGLMVTLRTSELLASRAAQHVTEN